MLKDSLRTHGMAGIVQEMSSQLELSIQVPMYSFGSECYSALEGISRQKFKVGPRKTRATTRSGRSFQTMVTRRPGFLMFPDVSLLCIAIARNDRQGRKYCTCSQDDLEPCGEMKGAPDFIRRV